MASELQMPQFCIELDSQKWCMQTAAYILAMLLFILSLAIGTTTLLYGIGAIVTTVKGEGTSLNEK